MFLGHFAVGMAGKKLAPGASLAWLWFAAIFADVLWPVLIALGAEEVRILRRSNLYTPLEFVSYPWSHSLLMLIVWGVLFAAFWRSVPGGKRIGAVLAALVVSHWFLDWITHRPDMPLWPNGPKYGLGLWNSVRRTMAVELVMFAIGIAIYLKATWARDGLGKWGFWAVMLFLFLTYLSTSFNRAPPRTMASIWVGAIVGTLIMMALAAFIEQHRDPRVDENGNPVPRRVRVDLR